MRFWYWEEGNGGQESRFSQVVESRHSLPAFNMTPMSILRFVGSVTFLDATFISITLVFFHLYGLPIPACSSGHFHVHCPPASSAVTVSHFPVITVRPDCLYSIYFHAPLPTHPLPLWSCGVWRAGGEFEKTKGVPVILFVCVCLHFLSYCFGKDFLLIFIFLLTSAKFITGKHYY